MSVLSNTSLATAAALAVIASPAAATSTLSPQDWLDRMSIAVVEMDFAGTLVRRQNGESETLKLIHKMVDGVVNERVVSQEGNGLEIIRVGEEVHCIVPDRKSVLIEQWKNQTTMLPTIPGDAAAIGPEYHLSVVREDRVAGRKTVLLAIRPHDDFRFGHRFWLDQETALPLRAELVDRSGVLLEQIKFADIHLGDDVQTASLAPSLALDDFTWYVDRVPAAAQPIDADWECTDLPSGFRIVSSKVEKLAGKDAPVTHLVYGDGLATVSVFIAENHVAGVSRHSAIGTTNMFSADHDGHKITVVGEVPAATVERIALSMQRR